MIALGFGRFRAAPIGFSSAASNGEATLANANAALVVFRKLRRVEVGFIIGMGG
jgi:hypothetical protein